MPKNIILQGSYKSLFFRKKNLLISKLKFVGRTNYREY